MMPGEGSSPMVSVIIPVYNGERYLAAAIDSVIDQDYPNLDIVIVNDGSTDGSAAIAQSYGSRLRHHYQENAGLSAAQNKGVALAEGEFISFLDCDDLWLANKISLQLMAFRSTPELDMVFGHMQQFVSPELKTAGLARNQEIMQGYSTGTMLARRGAFVRVGPFSSEFRVGEFLDWYGRATDSGLTDLMLPDVLLQRRIHENNMGIRDRDKRSDYLRVFKASLDRKRRKQDQGDL
jgi:glycosyltransferase involved in cell wall biosynthesis